MFNLNNPVASFIKSAKGALLSPVSFFTSIYWYSVSVKNSFVYFLICVIVNQILLFIYYNAIWQRVGMGNPAPMFNYGQHTSWWFTGINIESLMISSVNILLETGLTYLVLKLGFNKIVDFKALLSALIYASSILLLNWVVLIAPLVNLYGVVLSVLAVRESSRLNTAKAAVTVVFVYIIQIIFLRAWWLTIEPMVF